MSYMVSLLGVLKRRFASCFEYKVYKAIAECRGERVLCSWFFSEGREWEMKSGTDWLGMFWEKQEGDVNEVLDLEKSKCSQAFISLTWFILIAYTCMCMQRLLFKTSSLFVCVCLRHTPLLAYRPWRTTLRSVLIFHLVWGRSLVPPCHVGQPRWPTGIWTLPPRPLLLRSTGMTDCPWGIWTLHGSWESEAEVLTLEEPCTHWGISPACNRPSLDWHSYITLPHKMPT